MGVKVAEKGIEKIPGKALVKINQKIGFRFITKFGEKGIVNLGKLLPGEKPEEEVPDDVAETIIEAEIVEVEDIDEVPPIVDEE